jgi:hypothetical protein
VIAEKELLTIHAATDGARRIRLPRRCRVQDALTGQVALESGTEFTAELRRGETAVRRLLER